MSKNKFYIYTEEYELIFECFTIEEVLAFFGVCQYTQHKHEVKRCLDNKNLLWNRRIKTHKINRVYYINGILQEKIK